MGRQVQGASLTGAARGYGAAGHGRFKYVNIVCIIQVHICTYLTLSLSAATINLSTSAFHATAIFLGATFTLLPLLCPFTNRSYSW